MVDKTQNNFKILHYRTDTTSAIEFLKSPKTTKLKNNHIEKPPNQTHDPQNVFDRLWGKVMRGKERTNIAQ